MLLCYDFLQELFFVFRETLDFFPDSARNIAFSCLSNLSARNHVTASFDFQVFDHDFTPAKVLFAIDAKQ